MKKNYILFLLILALSMMLCCCTADQPTTPTPTPNGGSDTVDPTDDDYLEIKPRTVGALETYTLVFEGSAMTAPLPNDWHFEEKEGGGYHIYRDGAYIGSAESGYARDSKWRAVATDVYDMENGAFLYTAVEKSEKDGEPVFRHRLRFTTKDAGHLCATFFLPYEELDTVTFNRIYQEAELSIPQNNPNHGLLWKFPENDKILILGNSFISTSQIGISLQAMLRQGGINTEVVAISRGYARVGTYVNDSVKMQEIRNGVYDMVVICGLYHEDEIENLKVLRDICWQSDTPIVLFPAHNESASAIDCALIEVDGIYYLPWRDEINKLIAAGVDYYDMCLDDSHLHSTPLAGYVGAHMIYRAIFEKSPETRHVEGLLTQEMLEEKLGRVYLETGMLCKGDKMLYFS